jgi:hypothetical protein
VLKCVFQTITSHVEKYQKQTIICRRPKAYKAVACDAMTLGSFLKGCIEAGIWPTPLDPYQGFTVQSVLNRIAALRISSLCEINQDGMRGYGCSSGGKDAHDLIKTSMLSLKSYAESVLEGLELKDFK